jgi:hypothetical protein
MKNIESSNNSIIIIIINRNICSGNNYNNIRFGM